MPRNPVGILPRVKDAKVFERKLRGAFLNPFLSAQRARLARAGAAKDAYYALNAGIADLEATPHAGIPMDVIIEALGRVRDYNKARLLKTFQQALGVDIRPFLTDSAVTSFMNERIAQNFDLIKTIPQRYRTGMQDKIAKAFFDRPFDQQELMRIFAEEGKSSGYNLRRIVRDQTQKLNADLNQFRQQQLGVTDYIWRTSEDERVRETHRDNNGKTFAWASPPPTTGHPGNDVQCRCVSEAVMTPANRQRLGG